jgi:hypothetical protein
VKEMVRPQLPAYLLSLKKGLLPGSGGWDGEVRAGYISLKKASEVRKSALKGVDWDQFFQSWTDWVKKRLEGPLEGLYSADPKPPPSSSQNEGACKYCPFFNLCGLKALSREEDEGHHRDRGEGIRE